MVLEEKKQERLYCKLSIINFLEIKFIFILPNSSKKTKQLLIGFETFKVIYHNRELFLDITWMCRKKILAQVLRRHP